MVYRKPAVFLPSLLADPISRIPTPKNLLSFRKSASLFGSFCVVANGLGGLKSIEGPSGSAIDNVSFLVRVTKPSSYCKTCNFYFFLINTTGLDIIGCTKFVNVIPKSESKMKSTVYKVTLYHVFYKAKIFEW